MVEFFTGLFLGSTLTFSVMQYAKWKRFFISQSKAVQFGENIQFQNLMNYDGTQRGQKDIEHPKHL